MARRRVLRLYTYKTVKREASRRQQKLENVNRNVTSCVDSNRRSFIE